MHMNLLLFFVAKHMNLLKFLIDPYAFPCDHVVQFITTQHVGLQSTYHFLTYKITIRQYIRLKQCMNMILIFFTFIY